MEHIKVSSVSEAWRAADKEMRERKKEVERIAGLSIETIIVTMPQAVKNLQNAYEKLNIVEAKVENEIIQKRG